jgi:hypothetical protein
VSLPEPSTQLFFAGSDAPVSVTVVFVIVSVKYFQEPYMLFGTIGEPPFCQSPAFELLPFTVRSVRNSPGPFGRPETSEFPGAPAGACVPWWMARLSGVTVAALSPSCAGV